MGQELQVLLLLLHAVHLVFLPMCFAHPVHWQLQVLVLLLQLLVHPVSLWHPVKCQVLQLLVLLVPLFLLLLQLVQLLSLPMMHALWMLQVRQVEKLLLLLLQLRVGLGLEAQEQPKSSCLSFVPWA